MPTVVIQKFFASAVMTLHVNSSVPIQMQRRYQFTTSCPSTTFYRYWFTWQWLQTDSNWYGCIGSKSLIAIDCKFDEELREHLWDRIKIFLDKEKPVASQWIKDIVHEFRDEFHIYIKDNTEIIGEVPLVYTADDPSRFMICATQFSPYHKPAALVWNRLGPDLNDVCDIINLVYLRATKVIRSANQILRQEASEIIAFVASDSKRLPHPGLPQHIPIAYGLKGHSLPMSTMREMVNDVCDRCIAYNVNVHCEVYDGQFLNLVHYSEDGTPLTHLAFLQWFFKLIQGWTKAQCVNYLVTDTILNGVPLEVLITPGKVNLWKKHVEQVSRRKENRPASSGTNIHTLDQDDVTNLLQGSQLGSRLQRQVRDANSDEDSDESFNTDDGDDDSDADSDYIANDSDVDDIYFDSDKSSDLEDELEDILADAQELQPADQGMTF